MPITVKYLLVIAQKALRLALRNQPSDPLVIRDALVSVSEAIAHEPDGRPPIKDVAPTQEVFPKHLRD